MNVPELETPKLKFIGLNEGHLNDLFNIFKDEESMKYWASFPHKNIEETKSLFELLEKRIKNNNGMCWGLTTKETPQNVIGFLTYNIYKKNGTAVIGYILSRQYWNKGIMTEALKTLVEFGFSNLEVHRIEATVHPGNIASEKLLQKIGFEREGMLRERVYYKGKHQDCIYYGILKTDKRDKT